MARARKQTEAKATTDSLEEVKLPKSATSSDAALVDRVVVEIQGILSKTVARGMDEVGRVLLREFYDDNPENYRSQNPTKHASLRLLLDRCESMELPVRKTFLANALLMAVFGKQLPDRSQFLQLPPSHRVELLRLGSAEKAESFAATAVEKKMTVKKIRDVVRKEREKNKSNRGRKPIPPVLRSLHHFVRMIKDESTGRLAFRREDVDKLSEKQRGDAQALVETLTKRLEELGKLLG